MTVVTRNARCSFNAGGWKGFTLVELMVALLIASLVAALALPALSGVVARAEVKSTAGKLAAALRETRAQAIRSRRETSLIIDIGEHRFRITGDRTHHAFDENLEVRLLSAVLGPSRPDIAEVRFFPDGTSSGGEITVTRGLKSYIVRVEWLTGRVTIRENAHAPDS